jgi:FAD-dependent oxidoreductase domain-containing protein 1
VLVVLVFEAVHALEFAISLYRKPASPQSAQAQTIVHVVGRHPDVSNVVVVSGFSGHGLQHAPATGRAVSELVTEGRFTTLDLTRLGLERVRHNKPLLERNIV